jgi:glyoxylase-like metal-dependent hydrolase (beta-lactamase superfamily II)
MLTPFSAIADKDKKSFKTTKDDDKLYLHKVIENVYAIVGPLGNRSPENLGNNATFGFVVTQEGIVVVDPGGTYLGAKRIHDLIKEVSALPIKYVINTGGQDHRWLGNGYFKELGAKVIASENAVADQKARLRDILFRLNNTAGDAATKGTVETFADITFENDYTFTLGGIMFEIHHAGTAHSPGDAFVRLPKQDVIFSGDVVYLERLLSVMSFSNSKNWVSVFEKLAAYKPKYIVPGHGKPAGLEQAQEQTYNYLTMLRNKVSKFMDEGGVIQDVSKIDQSEYFYLENFELLKGRNVQQVYQEIEWE